MSEAIKVFGELDFSAQFMVFILVFAALVTVAYIVDRVANSVVMCCRTVLQIRQPQRAKELSESVESADAEAEAVKGKFE